MYLQENKVPDIVNMSGVYIVLIGTVGTEKWKHVKSWAGEKTELHGGRIEFAAKR